MTLWTLQFELSLTLLKTFGNLTCKDNLLDNLLLVGTLIGLWHKQILRTKVFGVFPSLPLKQQTNNVRFMLEMEPMANSTTIRAPNYTNKTLLTTHTVSTLCGSATTTLSPLMQPITSCLLVTTAHLKKLSSLLTTKVSVSRPTIGGNSQTC